MKNLENLINYYKKQTMKTDSCGCLNEHHLQLIDYLTELKEFKNPIKIEWKDSKDKRESSGVFGDILIEVREVSGKDFSPSFIFETSIEFDDLTPLVIFRSTQNVNDCGFPRAKNSAECFLKKYLKYKKS